MSPAHASANDVILAAIDVGPLHTPGLHRLGHMAGERIERFVVVIVGVERLEIESRLEVCHAFTVVRVGPRI